MIFMLYENIHATWILQVIYDDFDDFYQVLKSFLLGN